MKKLNKLTLAAVAVVSLLAGPSLSAQADSLSSKEVVTRTIIATPTTAQISGKAIDAGAYSSKAAAVKTFRATPANARIYGSPINASAYSSKLR